jgi:hypothetical protein
MLTDEEFLAFLNDKELDGSLEENLSKIIDDEMEKPEEEMDTELIEYCLDKLSELDSNATNADIKKGNGDSNDKHIKIKFRRVIAIVAVAAVLLVGTMSVSAVIFDVNLFDGMVELYNDYIRINFDKTDDKADNYQLLGTDLAKELADNGFDKVLLPEAIFSDEYEITEIEYESGELMNSANITFKYKNELGSLDITKYTMDEIVPDIEFLNVTSEIKEVKSGNVTIYCFMQGNSAAVTYRDGLSIYSFQVPMNLDKSIEFAKTIK